MKFINPFEFMLEVNSCKDTKEHKFLTLVLNFRVTKGVNFVFCVPLSGKNIVRSHVNALNPFADMFLILLKLISVSI